MKTTIVLGGLVAALSICALGLFGWAQTERLGAARDQASALESRLFEAEALAKALENDRRRTIAALEAVQASEKARDAARTILAREIDHAPATDDGPVAPVLRHALDGLRH